MLVVHPDKLENITFKEAQNFGYIYIYIISRCLLPIAKQPYIFFLRKTFRSQVELLGKKGKIRLAKHIDIPNAICLETPC